MVRPGASWAGIAHLEKGPLGIRALRRAQTYLWRRFDIRVEVSGRLTLRVTAFYAACAAPSRLRVSARPGDDRMTRIGRCRAAERDS